MPVAKKDKFHTCGGPRRRPCLGEGRGRRKMVVYLELDQQKWAQKMEELPSHQLISVVSATSTKSCWNDPVFARNKKFLDFKVRPLFFSPPKSDPQSRAKAQRCDHRWV